MTPTRNRPDEPAGGDDEARLDRLGRALVSASAMTDEELEAAVLPFVSHRAWARIVAGRERTSSATWADLLLVGHRAVPAMLAVTVALAAWFWIGSARAARPGTGLGEPRRDAQLEQVVLAGATMWSDDDVLSLMMNWPGAATTGPEDRR